MTVISPLFLISNTSAIFPGMDILGRERKGRHTGKTERVRVRGGYTYLQLGLDQVLVLSRHKKQEAGIRVAEGHSQQISFVNAGPPVMIEDDGRRLFGIVYPRGKRIGFPDSDGGRRGQERWGRGWDRFVCGLNGVGPVPAVPRALRLSTTGRHPANVIRLSDLTAQSGAI